ncbi:MAG: hypothetical protein ABFD79_06310 [Phycisphaerales bacterium]
MAVYYIGADVHNNNTELAVEYNKEIVRRFSVPTTIPTIRSTLEELGGRCHLTFEEGPMAAWLYRNLKGTVESITVCDPRRNKLIACDGDKDDAIDPGNWQLFCEASSCGLCTTNMTQNNWNLSNGSSCITTL